jgi:hypothetical protein
MKTGWFLRSSDCRARCSGNLKSHTINSQQFPAFTESANLSGISWALEVRKGLENEWSLEINGRFCSHVFDPPVPVAAQHIEPETVCLRVNQIAQSSAQSGPLGPIKITFEYGILNPLAIIQTGLCDPSQAAATLAAVGTDVIGD